MRDNELRELYLRLAVRVARLEEHVGVATPTLVAAATQEPAEARSDAESATDAAYFPDAAPSIAASSPAERPPIEPPALPATAVSVASAAAPTADEATQTFEFMVGSRWLAWAGSAVVLLAVGFFLQVAYEQGWLGLIPDGAKCALAAALGALLIGAGEWALRKVGRAAAVGLYAAGLGASYLSAYATFGYYGLVSEQVGFVLLAATAGAGLALTWRGRMLAIGVLSLLGGYGAPLLMHEPPTSALALPAYLTILLVVGLGLATRLPTPFHALRNVSLACHAALTLGWLTTTSAAEIALTTTTLAAWWGLLMAALITAAAQNRAAVANAFLSLLGTFAFVVAAGWALTDATADSEFALGTLTLCTALASALLALRFTPGVAALQTPTSEALSRLAIALWAQTGVLLTATIALYCDGALHSIGWLALALASVEVGRRLPSAGVQWFGLAVGAVAAGRVLGVDSEVAGLHGVWLSIGDVRLTYWGVLLAALIAGTQAAALRVRVGGLIVPTALTTISGLLWLLLSISQCRDLATTAAALLAPAALLTLHRYGKRQHFVAQAGWLLALVALKHFVIDRWAEHAFAAGQLAGLTPVLNLTFALSVALAAGVALLAWRLQHAPPRLGEIGQGAALRCAQYAAAAAPTTLLLALTFEIRHALLVVAANQPTGSTPAWPQWQALMLWSVLLWALGGLATIIAGLYGGAFDKDDGAGRIRRGLLGGGLLQLGGAATAWLLTGALARVDAGPLAVAAVLNLQALVGLLAAGTLLVAAKLFLRQPPSALWREPAGAARFALTGVGLIVLWCGTLEIDRYFLAGDGGGEMARQAALSVWWALFACGLITLGFRYRAARARYIGLLMLGGVLCKVLTVDLAVVRYLYRVLSLLATGLLLLGASVVYHRLASRLKLAP